MRLSIPVLDATANWALSICLKLSFAKKLLHFILQTEWTPAKQNREGRSLTMQAAAPTASEAREAMKEKVGIIL